LLLLLFDIEDGGSKFLRNVDELLTDYTAEIILLTVTVVIITNPKITLSIKRRLNHSPKK
jgi:hypothetical protein